MKKIIALIIFLLICITSLSYIIYQDSNRPPKIVYQDRIVYQDKIIYKNSDTADSILKASKNMLENATLTGLGDYINTDDQKNISEKELLKLMHQYNFDTELVHGTDIMDKIRPTE